MPTVDKSNFEGENLDSFHNVMNMRTEYVNNNGGWTVFGSYKLGQHHDAAAGQPIRGQYFDMVF
jgi:hypothetical protein